MWHARCCSLGSDCGQRPDFECPNTGPPPKSAPRPDVPDDAKLYVSNLPSTMNNDLLRSVFAPFGEVRSWAHMFFSVFL